ADGDRVRMDELHGGARLAEEALAELGPDRDLGVQDLDRDDLVAELVARLVDGAHAALSERREYLVLVADPLPGEELATTLRRGLGVRVRRHVGVRGRHLRDRHGGARLGERLHALARRALLLLLVLVVDGASLGAPEDAARLVELLLRALGRGAERRLLVTFE